MTADQRFADIDLLVLGAGMAGHSAAGYAAARGARVLLLEKAPETGGSAVLSGAQMWTAPTMEVVRDMAPDGDPDLCRHLVETYPDAFAWVRAAGPYLGAPAQHGSGRGYVLDVIGYFERCEALIQAARGWVLRGTTAERLVVRDGRVCGAIVRSGNDLIEVESPATVLATGGFQANRSLLRKYLGSNGDRLVIRSNPNSVGDGMALARAAGGAIVGDGRDFYGVVLAGPIVDLTPKDFKRLFVWYAGEGLLLNTSGERFTDESRGDHRNAEALALQPEAKALIVLDELLVQNLVRRGVTVRECFAEAARSGGRTASADSHDALGRIVAAWGFDGARVASSLREYNDHLFGRVKAPGIPRSSARSLLVDPPFYAQEVQVGITMTHVGLRVDTAARVLDARGRPVPGLYAAGVDIGGIYNGGYAGGLLPACIFGITAARTAFTTRLGESRCLGA